MRRWWRATLQPSKADIMHANKISMLAIKADGPCALRSGELRHRHHRRRWCRVQAGAPSATVRVRCPGRVRVGGGLCRAGTHQAASGGAVAAACEGGTRGGAGPPRGRRARRIAAASAAGGRPSVRAARVVFVRLTSCAIRIGINLSLHSEQLSRKMRVWTCRGR
jgi:hypothetical protein